MLKKLISSIALILLAACGGGVGVRWNRGDFFSDRTGEVTEIDLYGLYNRIIVTVSE